MHGASRPGGLPTSANPAEVVLDVLKWYSLEPIVVHSTSWRHADGRIVLTYIAVVEPPSSLPPDSLLSLLVGRAELARGEAMSAPRSIGVDAVLEHALRHLSWLVRDGPAGVKALAGWEEVPRGLEPGPLRRLACA